MSGLNSATTVFPDKNQGFRQEQALEKPVQRLRATVEPFSHTSFSTHAEREGTHYAVKEQVSSSRLTQISNGFPPAVVRYPPKSASLAQGMPLPWKDDITDAAGSAFPKAPHSNSIAPWRPGPTLDSVPFHHKPVTGKGPENQLCSTPISRGAPGQRDTHVQNGPGLTNYSELESRIQVHADVNKELKRLLVASIGHDLQHRVSQIAQEKATTAHRLDTSLQQLTENEEEMDRLNIECDIWRSKFLASRLMIDELATWKADVMRKLRESQRALQQLLQEQLELKRILQGSSSCLDGIDCHHNAGEGGAWLSAHQGKSVLDLARDLSVRCKTLRPQGSVSSSHARDALMVEELVPTSGEVLAVQVLSNGGQPCNIYSSQSLPLPLKLSKDHLKVMSKVKSSARSHSSLHFLLGTESHSIQFHCSRCKGKIYQV